MFDFETTASRRGLLTKAAVIGAGVAAAGLFTPGAAFAVTPALKFSDIPGTGDIKALNYALALEDLEADLYKQALQRLTTGGKNALGRTIYGMKLSSSELDVKYTGTFGKVETEHRDFLRAAIKAAGGPVISPFKYNFDMESKSRKAVLDLLYTAELTGTQAYLGAIPAIASRTYLQIAGSIQGTEARHTAVLAITGNILFGTNRSPAPLYQAAYGREQTMTPDQVLKAVSPYIVT